MPIYQRGDVCIRYKEAGSGLPLLPDADADADAAG
jgi:hypothetical protein